jgi:uncharacterized protein (TIGR03067 family)
MMKSATIMLVVVGMLALQTFSQSPTSIPASTLAVKNEKTKLDQTNMQGTWKVIEAWESGKQISVEKVAGIVVVIKGNQLTLEQGGNVLEKENIVLDASQTPKHIDLKSGQRDDLEPKPGIYELKGDELRICFPEIPEQRASKLVSENSPSPNDVLLVLKRETATTQATTAPTTQPAH